MKSRDQRIKTDSAVPGGPHAQNETDDEDAETGVVVGKASAAVDDGMKRGLRGLFSKHLRFITIMLWLVWAGFGLTYYGVILLITRIFMKDENLGACVRVWVCVGEKGGGGGGGGAVLIRMDSYGDWYIQSHGLGLGVWLRLR